MPPDASAYPDARERTAPPYPVHAPRFGGHKVRPHMPAPPAFTDEQIDAIMRAAAPLAPDDRIRGGPAAGFGTSDLQLRRLKL